MAQATVVYFSATVSFIFLCVGVIAGWTANEKLHEFMYGRAETENVHPEMLDEDGYLINEELLSVRFVDEDDEDYDD
ncbi:MAG: DUF2973 domain-containing protein [Candidatus Nanopelagicaceae bacterium]